MTYTRRTLLGAAASAGALALAGAARAQAKRKVVLGQSVPLTGAADQIGTAFAGGSKLFFDTFNGAKNNPGWTFELIQMDDGYDPARAAANARRCARLDPGGGPGDDHAGRESGAVTLRHPREGGDPRLPH